jgi:glycosyltransferase involved in cell wall biosynthesis
VLNESDRATISACNSRARIELIPNGASLPNTAAAFGSGDHILYIGRIDVEQKGLDLLLSAIDRKPPPLRLLIAGHGTPGEQAKLHDLVGRLQGGDVHVLGRISEEKKDELLRTCAFVVMPSRYETSPLVALEAMAYGKPVVHFDLPQFARLAWIDAGGAVGCAPFDVDALSVAIHDLAANPELRAKLGLRGRESSRAFDWGVIVGRYRDLVDALVASRA